MTVIDLGSTDMAVHTYSDGAEARVYGKQRDASPHPEALREHAYWPDGWPHFDELTGGGPRVVAVVV